MNFGGHVTGGMAGVAMVVGYGRSALLRNNSRITGQHSQVPLCSKTDLKMPLALGSALSVMTEALAAGSARGEERGIRVCESPCHSCEDQCENLDRD